MYLFFLLLLEVEKGQMCLLSGNIGINILKRSNTAGTTEIKPV